MRMLHALIKEARTCRVCAPHLPLGPQPVFLVGAGARRKRTLAQTVRAYREYLPDYFPLPHPSPRNRRWIQDNPWFVKEVVPALRRRLRAL
jgi:uracil-DNA glycosylase